MRDWYSILGVLPSIEHEALRPIYMALVKKYHPDVFRGDSSFAQAKTKELNEAYRILSDPELRQKFDDELSFKQRKGAEPTSPNKKADSTMKFESKRSPKNTVVFSRESISTLLDQYAAQEMGFFILRFGQNLFIQHGSLDGWLANIDVGNSGNPFLDEHKERLSAAGFILDDDFIVFTKKFSISPYDKTGAMKAIFEAAEAIAVTEGTVADLETDEDHLGAQSALLDKKEKNETSLFSIIFLLMIIFVVFLAVNAIPANFWNIKGIFIQH